MKRSIHLLIATVFAVACFLLWMLLTFVSHRALQISPDPPMFTLLCVRFKEGLLLLPAPALVYGFYIRMRNTDDGVTWQRFFLIIAVALVLVALPTIAASWLPLLQFIDKTGSR